MSTAAITHADEEHIIFLQLQNSNNVLCNSHFRFMDLGS